MPLAVVDNTCCYVDCDTKAFGISEEPQAVILCLYNDFYIQELWN